LDRPDIRDGFLLIFTGLYFIFNFAGCGHSESMMAGVPSQLSDRQLLVFDELVVCLVEKEQLRAEETEGLYPPTRIAEQDDLIDCSDLRTFACYSVRDERVMILSMESLEERFFDRAFYFYNLFLIHEFKHHILKLARGDTDSKHENLLFWNHCFTADDLNLIN